MPAPRLRKAVVALAAMLIVAIVTTQRPASASRPSSETDVNDIENPAPKTGLRHLLGLMRGRADARHDSVHDRMLGQAVAKPANASLAATAAAPKKPPTLNSVCPKEYQTPCNGKCVDTTNDRQHCGGCNKPCARGFVCDSGKPLKWPESDKLCEAPYRSCSGQCCHVLSDPNNCGVCGRTCGNGRQCNQGDCVQVTAPGKVKNLPKPKLCPIPGGNCFFSLDFSNNNCGGCGIRCPSDAYCKNGKCECRCGKCFCNGKCIEPGSDCKTLLGIKLWTCPKPCLTKKCGDECCSTKNDVCYDSDNNGDCDKCCPISRWNQALNSCCPENTAPCATGCCPVCPEKKCTTAQGQVCCPQKEAGTFCKDVPNNPIDKCCATDLCQTGWNSADCCKAGTQCKKVYGQKYNTCCPKNQVCGDTCCTIEGSTCYFHKGVGKCCPPGKEICGGKCCDACNSDKTDCCTPVCNAGTKDEVCCQGGTCYDDDTNPATPDACCPAGNWLDGACCPTTPATCPKSTGKKCCQDGEKCYLDSKGQKVCCAEANWDDFTKTCCSEARCKVKFFSLTVWKCCPSVFPGTTCQDAGYFDVCCATDKWDAVNKKCCTKTLCGKSCCDSGTCYDSDGKDGPDSCCTGTVFPATGTQICCPKDTVGYWNDKTPACCPKGRWTGKKCCSETEKACNGVCISNAVCCNNNDCPCNLPTGKMALACGSSCQCTQQLCCEKDGKRQCIQPDNNNCASCGNKCGYGKTCVQNTCLKV